MCIRDRAKLGHEEMPGTETHIYAPAYSDEDFSEIIKICDHIVFNSFSQWNKYKNIVSGTGIESVSYTHLPGH